MRVLTDPRGQVQSGVVAFVAQLLRRDIAEFGLVAQIEPDALAFALVRLGESFVYAGRARRTQARCRHCQPTTAPP